MSQKVKRGVRESRLKGNFVGGIILYGYKVIDKKVVIDEGKAPAVRYMFEEYANGKPKKQIVAELNGKGYRTNKGKPFTFNSFQYCLSNEKYIGIDTADGVENYARYPVIIDEKLFRAVQERLKFNGKRPAAQKAKVEYLLSGKAYCGLCGASMFGISGTSRTKGRHSYYACSCQYNKKACAKKYEKKDELEQWVVDVTLEYVLQPARLDYIAEQIIKVYENDVNGQRIKEYEKRIRHIDAELDKHFELFYKTDNDEFRERMSAKAKELELTKKDLKAELAKLKNALEVRHTKADILDYLQTFLKGDSGDFDFQKRIINILVNSVYVYDDGTKLLYFNIDSAKAQPFGEVSGDIQKAEPLNSAFGVRILNIMAPRNSAQATVPSPTAKLCH